MKGWMKNGLVFLLAAAILTGGFFSMDIIRSLLPSYQGQIVKATPSGETPLLYINAEEKLTFYPWTTYRPDEAVSITEYFQNLHAQYGKDDENGVKYELQDINDLIEQACTSLSSRYAPLDTTNFASHLRYQESTAKYYLSSFTYTGYTGESLCLDLVYDGTWIESLHVTPAKGAPTLSNDKRMQLTSKVERYIQAYRDGFETPTDPSSQTSHTTTSREKEADLPPSSYTAYPKETFSFSGFTNALALRDNPSSTYLAKAYLPELLIRGNYHMVFYEGDILLFFSLPSDNVPLFSLPSGENLNGLLLYYDTQADIISGYNLLAV